MLSRVAESIYWLNRYVERAENIARVVDVNLNLSLDIPDGIEEQWQPLILTLSDLDAFQERYDEPTKQNVTDFLTYDRENPNSIVACLESARENARSVREIISSEMWEQINRFYLWFTSTPARGILTHQPTVFFNRVKTDAHLFAGIADATMSHGEGWNFGRVGKLLERADKTSRILDVKYFILLPAVIEVGTPFDNLQWSALLRSASALEMYRKRHGRIAPERVAEFLVLDREFPRSILSCLSRAEESLRAISGSPTGTFQNPAEQHLGRVRSRLGYQRIEEVVTRGLHEYLDTLQEEMNAVDDGVFETFFALQPVASGATTVES